MRLLIRVLGIARYAVGVGVIGGEVEEERGAEFGGGEMDGKVHR